jgi:hypothetical protein
MGKGVVVERRKKPESKRLAGGERSSTRGVPVLKQAGCHSQRAVAVQPRGREMPQKSGSVLSPASARGVTFEEQVERICNRL